MTTATPHLYVDSDLDEGQTLVEWRRARTAPKRSVLRRVFPRRLS
jgi:hypothetical protein